jgi:hypothetical protein
LKRNDDQEILFSARLMAVGIEMGYRDEGNKVFFFYPKWEGCIRGI